MDKVETSHQMQESLLLMKQAQGLAGFGTWFWDIKLNTVTWSDTLFKIYGLNKDEFKATFEGYVERLHPEDVKRVTTIIRTALQTKQDMTFEERVIRPNGELRYLKSWGCVKTDKNGEPLKMIGACLDITDNKIAEYSLLESKQKLKKLVELQAQHIASIEKKNEKLKEISYIQSHVVRAPLAKVMGLTDLLIHSTREDEKKELFEYLFEATKQLDHVIKDIIKKTEQTN